MSKVENTKIVNGTTEDLQNHKNAIVTTQLHAQSLAREIAYHLWAINKDKLYLLDDPDCKGIGQYAEVTFGIKKSTTSEAIAAFERFGSVEAGAIKDEWLPYQWSTLIELKKEEDAIIKEAGVTSEDNRKVARDKVEKYKAQIAKDAALPGKRKALSEKWDSVSATIKELAKTDMERAGEINETFLTECREHFGSSTVNINDLTYDQCEFLDNMLTRVKGMINRPKKQEEAKQPSEDNKNEAPDPKLFGRMVFDRGTQSATDIMLALATMFLNANKDGYVEMNIRIANFNKPITNAESEIMAPMVNALIDGPEGAKYREAETPKTKGNKTK